MSASRSETGAAEPISVKVPEAVRMTGLSRSRIYELMKSGDIEHAKVGSSTLILVESVRRFVLSRRVPVSASSASHCTESAETRETAGMGRAR
ncbi:helix-turn-helix domain-containing protein [Sphingomonas sp. URHD0057]|uniref:helix-turn-helix domain-containing protein n=1 Tax=Sphingomonas sp. URHD0057 TaxID=1380389 RepID=UPI0022AF3C4B|nr:helix-turn-helix domain-containing protein [Sphingomonas sp. URHD0057]